MFILSSSKHAMLEKLVFTDVIYIIFNHLWDAVKNSRNAFRTKSCTTIPFGRIITNLLVHSKVVENLETEGIIKDLAVTSGSFLNALTLKKMKVIDTIIKTPNLLLEQESEENLF